MRIDVLTTGGTMPYLSRRSILAAMTGAAVGPAAAANPVGALPQRTASGDLYPSNTALYADPALAEGTDYGRRHRRHASFDDSETTAGTYSITVVLALHGGGIEPGTSELCLAIAGYHPADLSRMPAAGPVYDYWMFEGIRSTNNGELHVTSTHCDDPVALSLCAGAHRAVSLHGCTTTQAGLPGGTAAVLVGGRDTTLKSALLTAYAGVGIVAIDAAGTPELAGTEPSNIVNRTLTGAGAQLELTTPMRAAMFTTNTRPRRRYTTTAAFWRFVEATRAALAGA
jgi:phage replication-related protein YjqB (UPF0714/DUF867 family)